MPIDETEIARQEEAVRQLLRRLILASGFSQQELEDEMGVAHGYLSRLLAGNKRLTYRHILLLLQLLDVSQGEFWRALSAARRPSTGKRVSGEDVRRLLARQGVRPEPRPRQPEVAVELEGFKRELLAAVEQVLAERLAGLDLSTPAPTKG